MPASGAHDFSGPHERAECYRGASILFDGPGKCDGSFATQRARGRARLVAPANVPALPPGEGAQSERERLEQHRIDPACNNCHEKLDPIGFGFERYDAIGVYRETDSKGAPLTGAGEIVEFDPPNFVGPQELATRLYAAPETRQCVVRQVFRYAHGRAEVREDACAIEALARTFEASSFSFRELMVALVTNDAFRFVRTPPSTTGGTCP